jgi:ABC-type Fe3+-siderophore transport system permease subunit
MRSFGRLGSIVGGLLMLIFLFIILPKGLTIPWRILFATVSSLAIGAIIYFYFERRRSQGARPKKKAILSSAAMSNFSWRAATFEFSNESFAKEFKELNRPNLMET